MRDELRSRLEGLPESPGVYIFRDKAGEIIYIGKAKDLSSRVRSYFSPPPPGDYKGGALRREIDDLEITVCRSEVDALILESTLIKKHHPRFNVDLKDDKSYPYILVSINDEYPRIALVREKHRKGVRYYGPFVNARAAKSTVAMLHKVFPIRYCAGNQPGRKRSGRSAPCLYADMGLCLGPCRGDVDPVRYREQVELACAFLEGRYSELISDLESKMREQAERLQFEEAARTRNQIGYARNVIHNHKRPASSATDYDVIGLSFDPTRVSYSVAQNRGGFHLGNLGFMAGIEGEAPQEELVTEFIKRYYSDSASVPPEIIVPSLFEDEAEALANWLSSLRGSRVTLRVPLRGAKVTELNLANANAKLALDGAKLERAKDAERIQSALKGLASSLELSRFPLRIECYDISTLGGFASVGSMVVFQDGFSARNQYRRFSIKFTPGVNDTGMMQEVLYRRFKKYLQYRDEPQTGKSSWGRRPDLVIVDGGKGQLSAATEVLKVLEIEDVEIVALAERMDELFRPGQSEPVLLPRDSEALFLVQRIRDEAHRVAISYNRRLREKEGTASALDRIAGVGPGRKRLLVSHFGSPAKVFQATLEELFEVKGLGMDTAKAVYEAGCRIRESAGG